MSVKEDVSVIILIQLSDVQDYYVDHVGCARVRNIIFHSTLSI